MTTDADAIMDSTSELSPEEQNAACFTHTEYLLELGVFDDFDVAPTMLYGFLIPNPDCTPEQLEAAIMEYADELRDVARQKYGRAFPHSAEFWFCSTQEVPDGDAAVAPSPAR